MICQMSDVRCVQERQERGFTQIGYDLLGLFISE